MSRDKQIEEMAKILGDVEDRKCHHISCFDCPYGEENDTYCTEKVQASCLIEAGYRKASDVVREIFADLKQMWDEGRGFIKYPDLVRLERLYEQKYTEGEG